ncbi:RDD family protein [uncultured Draconibacterium sp.]|uniref:RDD family protein n=1 Tax=uncultured Draconibacterium sp. TaxID=1573823 RepID=UPI003217DD8F
MNIENQTLAGQGARLLNLIIDTISYMIIWIIISIILMLTGLDGSYLDETGESIPLIPLIIIIPTFWGYYIVSETIFQKTLGKLLTRTKVVNTKGEKPNLGQIIGRTLSRSIPFEYLSYLFTKRGVHDLISSTSVIKVKNE